MLPWLDHSSLDTTSCILLFRNSLIGDGRSFVGFTPFKNPGNIKGLPRLEPFDPIMIDDPAFASWFVNDSKIDVGQHIQNKIWTFLLVLQFLLAAD